jgi:mono/diheme cytochrome c family protein
MDVTSSPVPFLGVLIALSLAATPAVHADEAAAETKVEYNRDVRPILFDACISCHGPDSAARKAELRLDQRDAAIEMAAIEPGDPDSSEMIRRILSEDLEERMPPPETKKHLTDEQKQTLVRWIEQGAEYQPHWSFIPPSRPTPPEAKTWARNPIDRFILARMQAEGLEPAPEADRRTLARRVALDLTGLPPTPEMLDAFLSDESPEAYEKYVDALLTSPRWGEHRGRYWLDAARYADTHGIHIDNFREMWSYRDWVIKAFNANVPFDRFTIENLAGDLLPEASLEQQIGSGFNRCNITTSEGGAIDEEYAVLYTRDRTETTSQVWMGLTTGCAVCHDHKFDPLTQKEFYALSAFFNNTTQKPMDGNVKDTPPIAMVPRDADLPRWQQLQTAVPAAEQAVEAHKQTARPAFDAWLAAAKPTDLDTWIPSAGLHLHAPLNDGGNAVAYKLESAAAEAPLPATAEWREGKMGSKAAYLNQGAILEVPAAGDFEGDQPFSVSAWIKLPANDSSGSIVARMDDGHDFRGWDFWIEGRRIGAHVIHKWPENAIKALTTEQLPADQWLHVALVYDGSRKAAGIKVYVNGEAKPMAAAADALTATTRTTVPLKVGQRHATSPLSGVSLQDVRIYARDIATSEVSSLANAALLTSVVVASAESRVAADVDSLFGWWLANIDESAKSLVANRDELTRERSDIQARGTIAHVMQERPESAMAHVLNRGEYDQRLDAVTPDTPELLPAFPADLPRNRLGLAEWLMRPEHPLTARVTVNRFWQELFGQGLVRTAGDFGVSGELPSHPELLDWLAIEFRDGGWDVKKFYKLMVMSATYRQSTQVTPEKLERDADNRLLSRGPRFRMDAEMVRDQALAASGLLSPKIGGPSVKPYQPPGVWEAVAMIGSNTRDYVQDTGESLYRRSLYTFWKRSAPPASLDIFNAPNREHCVVVRERTNTPLQALVTLNDPQYVEAACQLAQRAMKEGGADSESRLSFIAARLLAREFKTEELAIVQGSLEKLAEHYSAHEAEAKALIDVGETQPDAALPPGELAAWTMVVNELMNLDEFLNK